MNGHEYSNVRTRMNNFFDNEISMYVLPDIDRLTHEIRPDDQGLRGCTIPLTMMLFGIIDLFGFLMRPDEGANKTNTSRNFQYLLSDSGYFPEIYRDNWRRIVTLFRHGVMHQFFSKASGISKAGLDQSLIYERDNIPILNVDILSRDFVAAIEQIRADIFNGIDPNLILRMNNRLNLLARDDYRDLNNLTQAD